MPKPPVTAVIIGCGHRGVGYGRYSLTHPDELKVVAIADPDPIRSSRRRLSLSNSPSRSACSR